MLFHVIHVTEPHTEREQMDDEIKMFNQQFEEQFSEMNNQLLMFSINFICVVDKSISKLKSRFSEHTALRHLSVFSPILCIEKRNCRGRMGRIKSLQNYE